MSKRRTNDVCQLRRGRGVATVYGRSTGAARTVAAQRQLHRHNGLRLLLERAAGHLCAAAMVASQGERKRQGDQPGSGGAGGGGGGGGGGAQTDGRCTCAHLDVQPPLEALVVWQLNAEAVEDAPHLVTVLRVRLQAGPGEREPGQDASHIALAYLSRARNMSKRQATRRCDTAAFGRTSSSSLLCSSGSPSVRKES